jgi:hypothetical protein
LVSTISKSRSNFVSLYKADALLIACPFKTIHIKSSIKFALFLGFSYTCLIYSVLIKICEKNFARLNPFGLAKRKNSDGLNPFSMAKQKNSDRLNPFSMAKQKKF